MSAERLNSAYTHLPLFRWAFLSAMVAAELLYLTFRFDSVKLAEKSDLWAELIEHASFVPQILMVVLTATLVFGAQELRTTFAGLNRSDLRHSHWWLWMAAQAGLFALFVPLTRVLFESTISIRLIASLGSIVWMVLALAIALCSCIALLPAPVWLAILRQHRLPLLLSLIVGTTCWGAGQLSHSLWSPLGSSTLWLVFGLLRISIPDVVVAPAEFAIGTEAFSVRIAPACSGYEGIGLACVFVATYLWWNRDQLRWPQAWALIPLAIFAMWVINGVRIVSLILIGNCGWQDVAIGGFHSQAGWLAFNVVTFGLIVLSKRTAWFTVSSQDGFDTSTHSPSSAYLMPLLALVATMMVTSAFSAGFDWLYPLRVIAVAATVAWYAGNYERFNWECSWSAVGLGVAACALWLVLEPFSMAGTDSNSTAANLATMPVGWAAGWLAMRVFGSVVVVPVAEELAFRGYLLRRLVSADFLKVPAADFNWLSLAVSSLLFGALHPGRWLAGSLAGLFFGLAFYRRGNLIDAVVAHATANALVALYVLTTGSWELWS